MTTFKPRLQSHPQSGSSPRKEEDQTNGNNKGGRRERRVVRVTPQKSQNQTRFPDATLLLLRFPCRSIYDDCRRPCEFLRRRKIRRSEAEMEGDGEIERLPVDVLANIFALLSSFKDLARASRVCRKWRKGVRHSLARKEKLSFAGWKMDDESTSRLVHCAYNIRELDISRSCWGSQISDIGLSKISFAKCVHNLTSISLWGMVGITDSGVIQLVSRAQSLQHLNIGGTLITDESLYAIAGSCRYLKSIILWSCRHVTENGLLMLVNKCQKLESINVWGMRLPVSCFVNLLSISPALQIKPTTLHLSNQQVWPIA